MKQLFRHGALLFLIIACVISVCGCSSDYKYVIDARDQSKDEVTETSSSNLIDNETNSINVVSLNPFEGLTVDFDGISPFCTVSYNNSKCDEEVQLNVEYSLFPDKVSMDGYFGIGEEVTIYASLNNQHSDEQEYILSETAKTYKIENVPQYLTEISADVDLTKFKQEAKDYMESITAFSVGENLSPKGWAYDNPGYVSSTNPTRGKIYFSELKKNSYSKYPSEKEYFNRIDITYSFGLMSSSSDEKYENRYFTVIAENVIQYPDGTIGWGKSNPESLDFDRNIDFTSMESLINANITSNKADYNVSEITDYFKADIQ